MARFKFPISGSAKNSAYRRNLKRSSYNIAAETAKSIMPNLTGTVVNTRLAYNTIRRFDRESAKMYGRRILHEKRAILGSIQELITNAKSDLKSGKLHNEERIAAEDPFGDMLGGFGDFNDEFDYDGGDYSYGATDQKFMYGGVGGTATARQMSNTLGTINLDSTEYATNVSILNTGKQMVLSEIHHKEISGRLSNIESINMSILRFNQDVVAQAIDRRDKFYDETSAALGEIRDAISKQSDFLMSRYGGKQKSAPISPLSEIFGSSGIDFKEYGAQVKKNIKGLPFLDEDMIKDFLDMFKSSPISGALGLFLPGLLPKSISKPLRGIDKSINGLFAKYLMKMNTLRYGGKNDATRMIASILGIDMNTATKPNLASYKDEGLTKDIEMKKAKAITEVIPTYLMKITESLTGINKSYDYGTGKFIDNAKRRSDLDKYIRNMVSFDMYDTRANMQSAVERMKDSKGDMLDKKTREFIYEDIDIFLAFLSTLSETWYPTMSYKFLRRRGLNLKGGIHSYEMIRDIVLTHMTPEQRADMIANQLNAVANRPSNMYHINTYLNDTVGTISFNEFDDYTRPSINRASIKSTGRGSKRNASRPSSKPTSNPIVGKGIRIDDSMDIKDASRIAWLRSKINDETTPDEKRVIYWEFIDQLSDISSYSAKDRKDIRSAVDDVMANEDATWSGKMKNKLKKKASKNRILNKLMSENGGPVGSILSTINKGIYDVFYGEDLDGTGMAGRASKYAKDVFQQSKDYLFGEIDEDGNNKNNGLFTEKVGNIIKKYVPRIGSGAATGALTGLIFKHPILGAAAGGAISILMETTKVGDFLWGDGKGNKGLFGELKSDLKKFVKDKVAKPLRSFFSDKFSKFTDEYLGTYDEYKKREEGYYDYEGNEVDEEGNLLDNKGKIIDALKDTVAEATEEAAKPVMNSKRIKNKIEKGIYNSKLNRIISLLSANNKILRQGFGQEIAEEKAEQPKKNRKRRRNRSRNRSKNKNRNNAQSKSGSDGSDSDGDGGPTQGGINVTNIDDDENINYFMEPTGTPDDAERVVDQLVADEARNDPEVQRNVKKEVNKVKRSLKDRIRGKEKESSAKDGFLGKLKNLFTGKTANIFNGTNKLQGEALNNFLNQRLNIGKYGIKKSTGAIMGTILGTMVLGNPLLGAIAGAAFTGRSEKQKERLAQDRENGSILKYSPSMKGRLIGGTAGLMLGGPLGAILGAKLGGTLLPKNNRRKVDARYDTDAYNAAYAEYSKDRKTLIDMRNKAVMKNMIPGIDNSDKIQSINNDLDNLVAPELTDFKRSRKERKEFIRQRREEEKEAKRLKTAKGTIFDKLTGGGKLRGANMGLLAGLMLGGIPGMAIGGLAGAIGGTNRNKLNRDKTGGPLAKLGKGKAALLGAIFGNIALGPILGPLVGAGMGAMMARQKDDRWWRYDEYGKILKKEDIKKQKARRKFEATYDVEGMYKEFQENKENQRYQEWLKNHPNESTQGPTSTFRSRLSDFFSERRDYKDRKTKYKEAYRKWWENKDPNKGEAPTFSDFGLDKRDSLRSRIGNIFTGKKDVERDNYDPYEAIDKSKYKRKFRDRLKKYREIDERENKIRDDNEKLGAKAKKGLESLQLFEVGKGKGTLRGAQMGSAALGPWGMLAGAAAGFITSGKESKKPDGSKKKPFFVTTVRDPEDKKGNIKAEKKEKVEEKSERTVAQAQRRTRKMSMNIAKINASHKTPEEKDQAIREEYATAEKFNTTRYRDMTTEDVGKVRAQQSQIAEMLESGGSGGLGALSGSKDDDNKGGFLSNLLGSMLGPTLAGLLGGLFKFGIPIAAVGGHIYNAFQHAQNEEYSQMEGDVKNAGFGTSRILAKTNWGRNLLKKGAKLAITPIRKAGSFIGKGIGKGANWALEKTGAKALWSRTGGKFMSNVATNSMWHVYNKVGMNTIASASDDALGYMAKVGTKGAKFGFLNTIKTWFSKALDTIATKVPFLPKAFKEKLAKSSSKIAEGVFKNVAANAEKAVVKAPGIMGTKIAEATAKLSNPIGWAIIAAQAIWDFTSGWNDVKNIMDTTSDYEVPTGMKVASGIIKVLDGLAYNIPSLVCGILGMDFKKTFITLIYKLLGNEEEMAKLEQSQASMHANYQEFLAANPGTKLTEKEYNELTNKSLWRKATGWLDWLPWRKNLDDYRTTDKELSDHVRNNTTNPNLTINTSSMDMTGMNDVAGNTLMTNSILLSILGKMGGTEEDLSGATSYIIQNNQKVWNIDSDSMDYDTLGQTAVTDAMSGGRGGRGRGRRGGRGLSIEQAKAIVSKGPKAVNNYMKSLNKKKTSSKSSGDTKRISLNGTKINRKTGGRGISGRGISGRDNKTYWGMISPEEYTDGFANALEPSDKIDIGLGPISNSRIEKAMTGSNSPWELAMTQQNQDYMNAVIADAVTPDFIKKYKGSAEDAYREEYGLNDDGSVADENLTSDDTQFKKAVVGNARFRRKTSYELLKDKIRKRNRKPTTTSLSTGSSDEETRIKFGRPSDNKTLMRYANNSRSKFLDDSGINNRSLRKDVDKTEQTSSENNSKAKNLIKKIKANTGTKEKLPWYKRAWNKVKEIGGAVGGFFKGIWNFLTGGRGSGDEARKAVVDKMLSLKGKYKYNYGSTPSGDSGSTDCSGLQQYVYKTAIGIDIGRATAAQVKNGKKVSSSLSDVDKFLPGDLIFYGSSPNSTTHVEMYIGNNQICGIGSGTGPNVKDYTYESSKVVQINRYIDADGNYEISDVGSSDNGYGSSAEYIDYVDYNKYSTKNRLMRRARRARVTQTQNDYKPSEVVENVANDRSMKYIMRIASDNGARLNNFAANTDKNLRIGNSSSDFDRAMRRPRRDSDRNANRWYVAKNASKIKSSTPAKDMMNRLLGGRGSGRGSEYGLYQPIDSGYVPRTNYGDHHYGVDVHADRGTPVYAAGDGVIEYSEFGHVNKNEMSSDNTAFSVRIKLDNPVVIDGKEYKYVYYTHLQDNLPYEFHQNKGDNIPDSRKIRVSAGDVVGYVGTANNADHLHISIGGADGTWSEPKDGNSKTMQAFGWDKLPIVGTGSNAASLIPVLNEADPRPTSGTGQTTVGESGSKPMTYSKWINTAVALKEKAKARMKVIGNNPTFNAAKAISLGLGPISKATYNKLATSTTQSNSVKNKTNNTTSNTTKSTGSKTTSSKKTTPWSLTTTTNTKSNTKQPLLNTKQTVFGTQLPSSKTTTKTKTNNSTFTKIGNDLKTAASAVGSWLSTGVNSIKSALFGGRGDADYYNQQDPRWANMSFGKYEGRTDTVGDGGCGPTTAATVIQKITGRKVTPIETSRFALNNGYKVDDGGTTPDYFDDLGSRYGVRFSQQHPNSNNTLSSLKSGKPVIFLGHDYTGTSPFGTDSHYVVGTGMDSNGNINILDPKRSENNRKFSARDILSNAFESIVPYGGRGVSNLSNDFGGRAGGYGLGQPIQSATVQGTGYGDSQGHYGVDLHAPMGTPVLASCDGYIDYSEYGHTPYKGPNCTAFSLRLIMDKPIKVNGKTYTGIFHTHLQDNLTYHVPLSLAKSKKPRVKKGDVIAYSGFANAAHLHIALVDSSGNPVSGEHANTMKAYGWSYNGKISSGTNYATAKSSTAFGSAIVKPVKKDYTGGGSANNSSGEVVEEGEETDTSRRDAANAKRSQGNRLLNKLTGWLDQIKGGTKYSGFMDSITKAFDNSGTVAHAADESGEVGDYGSSSASGHNPDAALAGVNLTKNQALNVDPRTYSKKITGEELAAAIRKSRPNSPLANPDQISQIMEAANKSGIDPRFIASFAAVESGWGTSDIFRDKNNAFGWNANDKNPYGDATNWNGTNGYLAWTEKIISQYFNKGQNTYRLLNSPTEAGMPSWHKYNGPGFASYASIYSDFIERTGGFGSHGGRGSGLSSIISKGLSNNGRGMSLKNKSKPNIHHITTTIPSRGIGNSSKMTPLTAGRNSVNPIVSTSAPLPRVVLPRKKTDSVMIPIPSTESIRNAMTLKKVYSARGSMDELRDIIGSDIAGGRGQVPQITTVQLDGDVEGRIDKTNSINAAMLSVLQNICGILENIAGSATRGRTTYNSNNIFAGQGLPTGSDESYKTSVIQSIVSQFQ